MSERFLLDELPALHLFTLRIVYWTVFKVKARTICRHVLSNFRRFVIPPKIVTLPMARITRSRMPEG